MKVCPGLYQHPVTYCRIFPATKSRLFRVDQTPEQNGTASALATHVLLETQSLMTTGKGGPGTAGVGEGPWPRRKSAIRPRTRAWSIVSGEHLEFMGSFSSAGSASPITQIAQLIYVRRAYSGRIALGAPLLRSTLYYACLLLVVGVTLPNWYVPPIVRRENKAVDTLRKYSTAMELYATTSKDASYPATLSALAPPLEAGKKASSGKIDAALMCGQASCVDNGYRFEFRPVFKEERVASYTISARPLEFEETGNRSLLLTADGKIYETRENRNALLTDRQR